MRPTIHTIAKLAGVSRGTVDRVINNKPYVNEEKRQRVLNAIQELGYTPNRAARALVRSGKPARIGVVYPGWDGYFEKELARGIQAAGEEYMDFGINLSIRRCESLRTKAYTSAIDDLMDESVAGLAIFSIDAPATREKITALISSGIPVVTFNSDLSGVERLCFVGQDRRQSGRLAAGLLARMGAFGKHIVIGVGDRNFNAHRDRVDGFIEHWVSLGGDSHQISILETGNSYDTTFVKFTRLLSSKRTIGGIYMANESTHACVDAIKSGQLMTHCPLIAHDLSRSNRLFLHERLLDFVIDQDVFFQGYRPVQLLADFILTGKIPELKNEFTNITIHTSENTV